MQIERAACTFYQCAGSGCAHMCCAALARIRTASKVRSFVYQPCSAQDRPVKVSVCSVARAQHQPALAERLRRENDRRGQANYIGKVGVNNSGCDPRLQDHYEPLPRGGTDASVASCIAPPSTTASTYRCKMCARARLAVDGVRARILATLRSCYTLS